MFKFKPKKAVNYRKNGVVYEIDMEGFDDGEEVRIIKNLIKPLSINRRVFIAICGDTWAIDKKAVLRMETDPRYRFVEKMEISPEKIEDINVLELLENMWTDFYFFCSSADWKEFIEMRKVKLHFEQGTLAAAIYLRNLDGIRIEIGEKYIYYMDGLLRQFQQENILETKRRK